MKATAGAWMLAERLGVRPDPWALRMARRCAVAVASVAVVWGLALLLAAGVVGLLGG